MTNELEKVAEDSARGGFFLVSGTALATVIMAASTILIGRLLGPELYGQYTLAFVIPQLLFLFTDLGVNQGVTKFAANLTTKGETKRTAKIVGYALLLRTTAGLLLFAINYVFADWLASVILQRPELTPYIRIASLSVPLQVVFTTATSAFVGLDKAEYNAVTTNVQALAKTTISIVLVLLGFGVAGALSGLAASYMVGSVAGGVLLLLVLGARYSKAQLRRSSAREDLATLMRYGLPLYVSMLLIGVIPLYQNFLLARFATDTDIGNYKEATNFASLMTVLSIPITTTLLAAFSKLDSLASQKINAFFRLANKYTGMIVIPASVLLIVFSRQVVYVVLGSEFKSAPLFLATNCLVFLLVGLGYLTLSSFFNGLGQTTTTMLISLVTFAAVAVLSPMLTMTYGVQGLVVAFIAANAAGTAYGLYSARRKFRIKLDTASLLKIYLVSAISAIPSIFILNLTSLPQAVKLAGGGFSYLFIYATLVPLARIVTLPELQIAMRIIQKTKLLLFVAKPLLQYQHWVLEMNKETLAVVIKIAVVLITTLALFFQDLILIFNDALLSETTSYVLAIPFLLGYLVYRKRKMIKAAIPLASPKLFGGIGFSEATGALLYVVSFLLYWWGSRTFTPLEYRMIALPIYVCACILLFFNAQVLRQSFFAVAFLFLLVPPPADVLYNLGALLSNLSSELAHSLLRVLGFPVSLVIEQGMPTLSVAQQNGETIRLTIDIACSGIYSQIGFFVFALFIAFMIRDRPWKKVIVVATGFPLVYLLNVLRITTMGIMGYYHGEATALNTFHLFGGWTLIFIGTFLLFAVSEKLLRLEIFAKPKNKCLECEDRKLGDREFCSTCGKIRKARFNRSFKRDTAKTAAIILSVLLILSLQVPVFALTMGPAEIDIQTARGQAATQMLPQNGTHTKDYALSFLYRDEDFANKSKQDASLVYAYFPYNVTDEVVWAVIEVAAVRSSLHRWETCLIDWPLGHGYPLEVSKIELRDIQLLQNPPVLARYFAFNHTQSNSTQVVLYWYETLLFRFNSTSRQEHVKVSLVAFPASMEALPQVEKQLLGLATEIAGYWQPVKTWSQIALLLSQRGDRLLILTLIPLAGLLVFYVARRRKERLQNRIVYQKLPKATAQVIEAIHLTERNSPPTFGNISRTYLKTSDKSLSQEQLMQEISIAERAGLVRRTISNRCDEPLQTWATDCSY